MMANEILAPLAGYKAVHLRGVVDAYLVAVEAFGRGSMRRREIERVTLNLRYFLEECGIVEPMFPKSAMAGKGGNGDEGK